MNRRDQIKAQDLIMEAIAEMQKRQTDPAILEAFRVEVSRIAKRWRVPVPNLPNTKAAS